MLMEEDVSDEAEMMAQLSGVVDESPNSCAAAPGHALT